MESKYYDLGPMLSYGMPFNMTVGHRGVGKTYGHKKRGIRRFIENGEQFFYVRRYKEELKNIRQFFDDVGKEFPGHEFEVKGGDKKGVFLIDGEVAGYYAALSIAVALKSTPYPKVTTIIFDEFLIGKGSYHYIQNEVSNFLDLVFTIFRDRPNGRVFLIANNITMSNPYFLFFDILPFKDRFYIDKSRGILCENYKNEAYIENINNQWFGKLIKGTKYYEYAVENEALEDSDTFICDRSPNSRFRFSVVYQGETVGFWTDMNEGLMYASRDIDPTNKCKYCLTRDDHAPNLYLIKNINNTHMHDIVFMFDNGLLRFEDSQIKSICYDILALFRK